MTKPFWEKAYADMAADTFGRPSMEVEDLATRLPAGARVLDLGCGEGRNALFMAEMGFDVTAVDVSAAGIGKVRALAERRRLTVDTEICDMRDYQFPHEFEAILSHGCLHLIERSFWLELIHRIKRATVPGGYNVVVVFTDAIPPPADLKDFCLGLFKEGELFRLYDDWEIILQQSYVKEDKHPGSVSHRHPINKLVAGRPGG